MKEREFLKELKEKGVKIVDGSKHYKLYYQDRQTTLPRHPSQPLKIGTMQAVKRQLNLK